MESDLLLSVFEKDFIFRKCKNGILGNIQHDSSRMMFKINVEIYFWIIRVDQLLPAKFVELS